MTSSRLDEFFDGQPERLTPKDVAKLLGVTDAAIYLWLNSGVLPGYKVGSTWHILRDELKDTMLAGQSPALRPHKDPAEDPDAG
jgi:excisionase family DNA binding protein